MGNTENGANTYFADAMAMGSWAADAEGTITFVSPSLQVIIWELCKGTRPESPNWLRDAWGESGTFELPRVKLVDFLGWFLARPNRVNEFPAGNEGGPTAPPLETSQNNDQSGAKDLVLREINKLMLRSSDSLAGEPSERTEREGSLTTVSSYAPMQSRGSFATRSLRFMHDLGLQLGPDGNQSITRIYDLIVVQRFRSEATDEPKLHGYQGQVLGAWERVQPVMQNAVKAATLRLLSRSLSHNIGSHALDHLQRYLLAHGRAFDEWFQRTLDWDGEAGAAPLEEFIDLNQFRDDPDLRTNFKFKQHAALYSSLRDRFEALAAVSTSAPLPWLRGTVADLVNCVPRNKNTGQFLVWMHICRSEGVNEVKRSHDEGSLNQTIALPGGNIALQAFSILIENLVRDCAKYENHGGDANETRAYDSVSVHLTSEPVECGGECFVKIVMGAQRTGGPPSKSQARDRTVAQLKRTLEGPFCTPLGEPLQWGTQERLAAACLLRGLNPYKLVPGLKERKDDVHWQNCRDWRLLPPRGTPELLTVELGKSSSRIEWTVHLPGVPRPAVATAKETKWDHNEFRVTGWQPVIEQEMPTTKELVLDFDSGSDDTTLSTLDWGVLPPRLFILGPEDKVLGLEDKVPKWAYSLQSKPRSKRDLLECLVKDTPSLKYCDSSAAADDALKSGSSVVHSHGCQHYAKVAQDYLDEQKDQECGSLLRKWKRKNERCFYEAHESGWHLRDWMNAAAGRVAATTNSDKTDDALELQYALAQRFLVLDERIGKHGQEGLDRPVTLATDNFTLRQKWALCGVDVPVPPVKHDRSWWDKILNALKCIEDARYRGIFVHLGILDKIKESARPDTPPQRIVDLLKEMCDAVPSTIIVVHSGRNYPQNALQCTDHGPHIARFCQLGNLEMITSEQTSKMDLVDLFDSL